MQAASNPMVAIGTGTVAKTGALAGRSLRFAVILFIAGVL